MKKAGVCLCGFLLLFGATQLQAGEFFRSERPVAGSYIVVFKPEVVKRGAAPTAPGRTVEQLLGDVAVVHGARVVKRFEHALEGGVVQMPEAAARRLAADPRVAWVEEDSLIEAFATQATPLIWDLDRIDERDLPDNNHYTYPRIGTGVNIYVLDTGVASHSELSGRLINTYSTVKDAGGNPIYGDPVGHGTNVAIKAAGTTYGVAKGAKVRAVRIKTQTCTVPGGGGNEIPALAGTCFVASDVIDAINWTTANRIKPAVANLSLGGPSNTSLDTAVASLVSSGVTVVAAAGNSNASACNVSPAKLSQVITVGATDHLDSRAFFVAGGASNYGSCVNVFAPGKYLQVNNTNSTIEGTSFAAPLASGVAALYLQQNPNASAATVKSWIESNATAGRLTNLGTGSPNRLLYMPPGGTEVDNLPNGDFSHSCTGRTCTFYSVTSDDFAVSHCEYTSWFQFWFGSCAPSSYTFPTSGPWDITMWVWDDGLQIRSITKTINVP